MKIAILGWGSLIWQPKELSYEKSFDWKKDGPILPIEFARISNDGRLTLVITPSGTKVSTLYTLSKYTTVQEAVSNLKKREKITLDTAVGRYDKHKGEFTPNNFAYQNEIREWILTKNFDAVIWTNLLEKWEITNDRGEIIEKINPDNRIDYLKKLTGETINEARQYIQRTPTQIRTKYREVIEKELGWFPTE